MCWNRLISHEGRENHHSKLMLIQKLRKCNEKLHFPGGKKTQTNKPHLCAFILKWLYQNRKCFLWKRCTKMLFFSAATHENSLNASQKKSIFWSRGQCKEKRDVSSKKIYPNWVFRLSWCSLLYTQVLVLIFKKKNPVGSKPVRQISMPRKFMGKILLEAISQLSAAHPSCLKSEFSWLSYQRIAEMFLPPQILLQF